MSDFTARHFSCAYSPHRLLALSSDFQSHISLPLALPKAMQRHYQLQPNFCVDSFSSP